MLLSDDSQDMELFSWASEPIKRSLAGMQRILP